MRSLTDTGLYKVCVLVVIAYCNPALAQEDPDQRKLRLAAPPATYTALKELIPFEYKDHQQDYPKELRVKRCRTLDQLAGITVKRAAIEFLIHCEVLRRYNIADVIELIRAPNNARAIRQVITGQADALAVTNFLTTYTRLEAKNVLVTEPLLQPDEIKLGLFSAPNRKDILNIKNAEVFKSMVGVTVSHWDMDLMVMKSLTDNVLTVADHLLIPGMLQAKRADFTLHRLSEKHILGKDGNIAYARIDGFKVALPDARAFIIHSSQKEYFEAMQDFIRKNRAAGKNDLIMKAYSDIGWISIKYKDWILLNDF